MGKKTITRTALLGALCLPILPALAQEGGILLSFGIDQRFEAGNNLALEVPEEGSSVLATTDLSFGLTSETTTQSLAFDVGAGLQIENSPNTDGTVTDFADPRFNLAYRLEGATATFGLNANYRQAQIDTLSLSDFVDEDGLIELPEDFAGLDGTGTRTNYGLRAFLELGREAPLGFTLSGGISGIDYTDTVDPDLFDIARSNVRGQLRFRFSPVLTGTAALRYATYDADDAEQTYRTTTGGDLGLQYVISERARLNASVGITEIRTEELGQPDTTTSNPVGNLGFVYDMPNGTASADFDATTDEDGQERLNFVVGRSLELPDGAISATLGFTDPENDDPSPIGSLLWRRDLPDGQISARIRRSVTSSNNDESRLSTLVAFGYDRNINDLSGIGFDIVYGETSATETENEVRRIDLSAAYRYALTPEWNLNTGVSYQVRDEDTVGRAESPSVFLSIGRQFDFRP